MGCGASTAAAPPSQADAESAPRPKPVVEDGPSLALAPLTTSAASAGDSAMLVHGPLIGEVSDTTAVVWFRDARPRETPLVLKWWPSSGAEAGDGGQQVVVELIADADSTSKTLLSGLTPGTAYSFRVGDRSGSFKTPGTGGLTFCFGSCVGGQGYGRNGEGHAAGEGFPIFAAMAALQPDFCHINGDSIYGDNAIEAESSQFWNKGKKYVTPPGESVLPAATDLAGFRLRYQYHLEDPTFASFLANTPVYK